jgi:peptide deformylase
VTTRDPDSAVLRERARDVRKFDRDLKRLVQDMIDTMREAPGVGLAAPQVGLSLRLVVVETPLTGPRPDGPDDGSSATAEAATRLHVLVNPQISWLSEELEEDQEACLSIPGLYGDVPRHVGVRLAAQDLHGRPLTLEAQGYEARVLQHEVDHLDGVLYLDRVTGLDKLYTLRKLDDGSYERVPYAPPV